LAGISILKKDYKEACRFIIGDPTNEGNKQAFQAREYYEKGDFQKAFETFPMYFFNERKMIKEIQKGENKEKRAYLKCDRKTREILFNASQSYLFNLVASERINRGLQILKGDVALLAVNLAPFIVEDPIVENQRLLAGEIHIGGPLFGFKMIPAKGEPLEIEDQILAKAGVSREDFIGAKDDVKFQGSRRPIMVRISDISFQEVAEDKAKLSFFLPSGSYATVVLQEIFHTLQDC
jgi:tRNA pseudouridine13 synthase